MAHTNLVANPGGPAPYVVHTGDDGLSRRGRVIAIVLALALLLVGAGALYAAGAAPLTGERVPQPGDARGFAAAAELGSEPTNGGQVASRSNDGGTFYYDLTDTAVDGAIQAEWDGPTTHLDWKGTGYSTAEATFIGDRVVSPGDEVQRTLNIGNGGPSDAVMSVGLLLGEDFEEVSANPELAEEIEMFWDVAGVTGSETFAALLDRQRINTPVIAEVQVPKDAVSAVTVGFRMSKDVTEHKAQGEQSTLLSFQVLAQMQGDTTTYVGPDAPPKIPVKIPVTGIAIGGGVALVLGLLALGWLFLAAARRRRLCDDCDRRIGRDEQWTEYHLAGGETRIQCEECHATIGALAHGVEAAALSGSAT